MSTPFFVDVVNALGCSQQELKLISDMVLGLKASLRRLDFGRVE